MVHNSRILINLLFFSLGLQEQRYSGQSPFARFVFGLQIEGPHVSWTSCACLIDGAFVHVPQVLLVLGDGLQKNENKNNKKKIEVLIETLARFIQTCAAF